ncbi:hypothetical protein Pelo_11832 [Pelomyxa schiedti]|nr:hypothetical protein Pelo_11832 [Pelomyxa schiedti]
MDSRTSVHVIKTACRVLVAVFVRPAALPDSAQSSVSPIPLKSARLQSLASKAGFVFFVEKTRNDVQNFVEVVLIPLRWCAMTLCNRLLWHQNGVACLTPSLMQKSTSCLENYFGMSSKLLLMMGSRNQLNSLSSNQRPEIMGELLGPLQGVPCSWRQQKDICLIYNEIWMQTTQYKVCDNS